MVLNMRLNFCGMLQGVTTILMESRRDMEDETGGLKGSRQGSISSGWVWFNEPLSSYL
ncbi:hypothetical protein K432DRAFT_156265 [Lepidopterella palustris CBS 459.81]|uniref:Uncharacterized protein n=1 Tax=Lepidopterella palustris CBS 459.81 TaxID=1314670 RepID=A0A8E2E2K2_9PEZI|nr:hypothetical protein K432DRAFT_156265 [Lepidopterella palustris CBS 459.81]